MESPACWTKDTKHNHEIHLKGLLNEYIYKYSLKSIPCDIEVNNKIMIDHTDEHHQYLKLVILILR